MKRPTVLPFAIVGIVVLPVVAVWAYGLTLPSHYQACASTVIHAPPGQVWATMTDWEAQTDWRAALDSFEGLGDEAHPDFRVTYTNGRVLTFRQSDVVEASTMLWTSIDASEADLDATWRVTLEPEQGGTRTTIVETGQVNSPMARTVAYLLVGMELMPRIYLMDLALAHNGQAVFDEERPCP